MKYFFYHLSYCLAQLLEMSDQFGIVKTIVDVEAVPQVATDHHATEAQVLSLPDVVKTHAAHGIHLAVYQPLARSLFQFVTAKRGMLFRLWFVSSGVCERSRLLHRGLFKARTARASTRRSRIEMHGIHELVGQAGTEGRCERRQHLGRSVDIGS